MKHFYYELIKYETELSDDALWKVILSTRNNNNNNKSNILISFCKSSHFHLVVLRLIFEYSNFQTARFLYEPIYFEMGRAELEMLDVYNTRKILLEHFYRWKEIYDDIQVAYDNNDYSRFSSQDYETSCKNPMKMMKTHKRILRGLSTTELWKQLEDGYLKIRTMRYNERITNPTELNFIHAALLYEKKLQEKLKAL